ncbi:hypothetical protein [Tenacibaculum finnmarkense]|uniref:Lipoprotein n=1 Tax=Tenacibaculum finnmarkense genomovar finnmarkense TaxID=1458503 RepID=A0AAP1RF14_9FLAO|nr:hypothetical protein [Tenacibaculum finnmarkense]MBE7645729.1 hypothetical protein [Tenacibaculum finnmarkense genomovar ulcerans]MBE7647791.1 hypothetical protein [Tenacibaculum finnmarkense genomovar ulcerans]MBE7652550.1 hypothetical protein [Tenacibaculum finnmarkense genomovar finnmarkense]MBE7660790.1 hypothetical protein [Tenacibaculum finnmarkense genomovar finnmarkense]MBE7694849.1 hypothetical protein [Tenacibaculum finnmarkense genomovar finnmarkense]
MKSIKVIILLTVIGLIVMGCKHNSKEQERQEKGVVVTTDFSGNYVTASYKKRSEGYDWVAVSVAQNSAEEIYISVRSRADGKKPTCTFDTVAKKAGNNTFKTLTNGKIILFSFKDNKISISTEKFENRLILNFYCSGGGSLAGDYEKINESLDKTQIDKK